MLRWSLKYYLIIIISNKNPIHPILSIGVDQKRQDGKTLK